MFLFLLWFLIFQPMLWTAWVGFHLTHLSESTQGGEVVSFYSCNYVKTLCKKNLLHLLNYPFTEVICTVTRGETNSQCTVLIYQVKWGKESRVSECPHCLQAAEPFKLVIGQIASNSLCLQQTITLYQLLFSTNQQECVLSPNWRMQWKLCKA